MGELLQIYIPKCRVRDIVKAPSAVMVGVFPNLKQAEEACKSCRASIQGHCPVTDPGVTTFVPDERPI